ncbi:MAG: flagellar protein FlgN [Lachnospiraceae bacterium]|nr:flagellar protein FlgN [Lachnospiraceae bacterium]
MASLIEELITVLKQEEAVYRELLPVVEQKTQIIIRNDLTALQKITEQEQLAIEKVTALEHKRDEVIVNMGVVLSRDPRTLTLKKLISLLDRQPKEQKELTLLHDSLTKILKNLSDANLRNQSLIEQSLEMIEFNMNLIQSTRMSPGSGNYTRNAHETNAPVGRTGMFDARQ